MSGHTGVGSTTAKCADPADDTVIKVELDELHETEYPLPLEVSLSNSVMESKEIWKDRNRIGGITFIHSYHDNPCSGATEKDHSGITGSMATAVTPPKQFFQDSDAVSDAESNYRYRCLICYEEYFNEEHEEEDLGAHAELYNVFCKYMQIQSATDHTVENHLFCHQCAASMRTLSQLDAELETLRLKTQKIAVNCTATLLESYNPRARVLGNRMVDKIRSQIFRRYHPRVSLHRSRADDGCEEKDLFVESDVEMKGGPTDDEDTMNDPCDNAMALLPLPEPEVDPRNMGSQSSSSLPKTRNALRLTRSTALRAKENASKPPKLKSKRGRPSRQQTSCPPSKKIKVVTTYESKRPLRRNLQLKLRGSQSTQPTVGNKRCGPESSSGTAFAEDSASTQAIHCQGVTEQSEDLPSGTASDDCDDDHTEPEDLPKGGENGEMDPDYLPGHVFKKKKPTRKEKKPTQEEKKLARTEKPSLLKKLGPGKYIFAEKYDFDQTEGEAWTCGYCQKRVKTWLQIYHHVRKHYWRRNNEKKKWRMIDIGDNQFLYANEFYVDKLEDLLSCRLCGFVHHAKPIIQLHIRRAHMTKDPFVCEECGKIFSNNLALTSHMKRIHEVSETMCPTCGKSYRNAITLKMHMRDHLVGRAKPKNFVCEHCGKAFDCRIALQSHSSSHTGEKPFQCRYCLQSFRRYNTMTAHRKNRCDKNPQRFDSNQRDLQQPVVPQTEEMNVPIGEIPLEQPPPPLPCAPGAMNCFPPLVGPVGPFLPTPNIHQC